MKETLPSALVTHTLSYCSAADILCHCAVVNKELYRHIVRHSKSILTSQCITINTLQSILFIKEYDISHVRFQRVKWFIDIELSSCRVLIRPISDAACAEMVAHCTLYRSLLLVTCQVQQQVFYCFHWIETQMYFYSRSFPYPYNEQLSLCMRDAIDQM
jgi:hypothetical protein